MALLNKGTVIAIDEEVVIGAGQAGTWLATDVVSFNDDSGLTPATATLERNVMNSSFLGCQGLAGQDSTSGNLNVDLGILPKVGTESGKLNGHLIFKSGLGKYVQNGAIVDLVGFDITEEIDSVGAPSDHDLYTLSKPDEGRTTLCVREFLGGSGDAVLDHKGVVVDSMAFDFSAGNIVKVTNSVSGIGYATPSTTQTVLPTLGCGGIPFVTKSAIVKLDSNTLECSNVSLTITNSIVDRNFITSEGIGDKVVTAKSIELSYTIDLTPAQMDFYNKMKANLTGEMFIGLTTATNDKCYFYFPVINFTNVTKNNDSGVITLSCNSMAYENNSGDALLIATKKGV